MARETQEETRMLNEAFFEKLHSKNPTLEKQAIDAVNDFTRTKMREQGFVRSIMPPIPVSNSDLTRQLNTDKPMIIVDKEPGSPASVTVGFATLPTNLYIKGNRYAVPFARLLTPRFTKDTTELRTWIMDIRQVLSDNALKDLLAEEDGRFIAAVNTILRGAGVTCPTSGIAQWRSFAGITRDNLFEEQKIIRETPSNLKAHTALVNHVTVLDVCKFQRNEAGGDLAEDFFKNGFTQKNLLGLDWIVTIKRAIVPNDTIFYFSDPAFMGKFYELEPTTMYIRREAFLLEFFAYEEIGCTIGHTDGLARADH